VLNYYKIVDILKGPKTANASAEENGDANNLYEQVLWLVDDNNETQ
jgi:hypothetical protein